MTMRRRHFVGAVAAASLVGTAAWAQRDFPNRPITLICPWPPGGGADLQLRMLAKLSGALLGQPMVVENRPGVTGSLGAITLMQTKPDGYTLCQSHNAVLRQPFIAATPYDPLKDFTYLIGVSDNPFGLVVRADSPWKTMAQFLEHARGNPGKVNIAMPGNGSPGHLVSEQIATAQGLQWTTVPYRGTANSMLALLGGQVDAAAESTGWVPFVESGKVRLLAVFGKTRMKKYPDVPTLIEININASDYSPWGIVGPAGMDPAIAKTLHDGMRKAMLMPEFTNLLSTLGQEPIYMSPADYVRYVSEAVPQQKAIVEKYNLKAAS